MSATRILLPRAPLTLFTRLTAASGPSVRPCQHLLRRFSQTQAAATSSQTSFQSYPLPTVPPSHHDAPIPEVHETKAHAQPAAQKPSNNTAPEQEASRPKPAPRRKLRPRKAAITLTPTAVEHLRGLLNKPDPQLLKIGVRNRGCSGLAYHLEYVDKAGPFDEAVEQDGVKVLIDSKALFSIIGSKMDWIEDKLNERFHFENPNIKEACGCGESFMV
ncbi:hypothetical protein F5Y15DRAFT_375030 [Xylariaceae sp. FL0016]|nr:hypothetical protein F5Y15DRAFT_375030 [Xylariaceae sp. FL0016]